jgi:3-hydroxyisobutyrate dehydrogenase-like beta-hydroxyacid dehydrogenase
MRLGFIGFGEAGYCLARALKRQDLSISAYRRRPELAAERAREAGVRLCPGLEQALEGADLVLSCVWPHTAVEAAEAAAQHLRAGQLFADLNSVAPETAERIQRAIAPSCAGMAKIGVMGSIILTGLKTPMVIGGPAAKEVQAVMAELGFDVRLLGEDVRAPAALKILRAYVLKAMTAASFEMVRAAHRYGLAEDILQSAAEFLGWPGYPDKVKTSIGSMAIHAGRRAREMDEAMDTLRAAGLGTDFAEAVQRVYQELDRAGLRELFGEKGPKNYVDVLKALEQAASPAMRE